MEGGGLEGFGNFQEMVPSFVTNYVYMIKNRRLLYQIFTILICECLLTPTVSCAFIRRQAKQIVLKSFVSNEMHPQHYAKI